jgi:hypothetical protein
MVIYQAAISAIYPGLTSKKRKVIPKHVYIVKLGDKLNYNDDPSPNLRNVKDGRITAHPYCCAARPQSSWLPPSRSINGGAAPFSIFDHMLTYYCYIFYHATHLLFTLHLVLKKPLKIICFAQAGRIFSVKKYPTSMNSAD